MEQDCVGATGEAYRKATIGYNFGPEILIVDGLFDTVCSNVIENAAQHNTSDDP